jgi:hypothetical protein
LLAIGSESKAITVQVNRFGEQYLDLVCLVFLWLVCLVGLLCLSSLRAEMKRREGSSAEESRKGVVIQQNYSFDVLPSFLGQSAPLAIDGSREGFYDTDETSLSVDDGYDQVSVSVVVQQEESRG